MRGAEEEGQPLGMSGQTHSGEEHERHGRCVCLACVLMLLLWLVGCF